jgi:hypothetical protein
MQAREVRLSQLWAKRKESGEWLTQRIHSGDILTRKALGLLEDYQEFKLDKQMAPHTVGSSHMYIRKDIVEKTAREEIVPPYPIHFPHGYPYKHEKWYLGELKKRKEFQ